MAAAAGATGGDVFGWEGVMAVVTVETRGGGVMALVFFSGADGGIGRAGGSTGAAAIASPGNFPVRGVMTGEGTAGALAVDETGGGSGLLAAAGSTAGLVSGNGIVAAIA